MDEAFVNRAAPLLKDGYSAASVVAAVADDDPGLLRMAHCNGPCWLDLEDRVMRFTDRAELRRVFALFVQAYEGAPFVRRVSYAYGNERIDFHNHTSILFRVQPRRYPGSLDV